MQAANKYDFSLLFVWFRLVFKRDMNKSENKSLSKPFQRPLTDTRRAMFAYFPKPNPDWTLSL